MNRKMTIFQLVKLALDKLYAQGEEEYGENLDEEIKKRIDYLSEVYGRLNRFDREPVDYRDPATRFAYAYKYVPVHGDYIVQILQKVRRKIGGVIFKNDAARLSCIGGGPGSDLIAILKYIDENKDTENIKKLTCFLLDKENAWGGTWTEIFDSLISSIQLVTHSRNLDVLDSNTWKWQRDFLSADIFTMIYFISEIYSFGNSDDIMNFWNAIFYKSKPGALFVYIDNGHDEFTRYFDKFRRDASLECLIEEENTEIIPRFSEQSSEFTKYKTKFKINPKIKSYITYRVLRKPER
jgi:ribosomal protein RSM22 (predicted rRNA methylase)